MTETHPIGTGERPSAAIEATTVKGDGLVERLRESRVIKSGETLIIDMHDGHGPREVPTGDIVQLRNPDGPEAADTITTLKGEIERRDAALREARIVLTAHGFGAHTCVISQIDQALSQGTDNV